MEEYFVVLKSALVEIDQSPGFSNRAIVAKISLLSECVRNIMMSEEPEIAQKFDEGFRNPAILSDVIQDGSAVNIIVQILEIMEKEAVREDRKAKINNIISYFKSGM